MLTLETLPDALVETTLQKLESNSDKDVANHLGTGLIVLLAPDTMEEEAALDKLAATTVSKLREIDSDEARRDLLKAALKLVQGIFD